MLGPVASRHEGDGMMARGRTCRGGCLDARRCQSLLLPEHKARLREYLMLMSLFVAAAAAEVDRPAAVMAAISMIQGVINVVSMSLLVMSSMEL